MEKFKIALTANNDFFDFVTGEIKQEGVNGLMNSLLVSLGNLMSNTSLPDHSDIKEEFNEKVYLSKEKSEKLARKLESSLKAFQGMGTENTSTLRTYKDEGVILLGKLQKELNKYIGTFDALYVGSKGKSIFKKSLFGRYNVDYDRVLNVKKSMLDSLKKLNKIASSEEFNNMTYNHIFSELKSAHDNTLKDRKNAAIEDMVDAVRVKYMKILHDFYNRCAKRCQSTEGLLVTKHEDTWHQICTELYRRNPNISVVYQLLQKLMANKVIEEDEVKRIHKAMLYTDGISVKTIVKGENKIDADFSKILTDGQRYVNTRGYKVVKDHIEKKIKDLNSGFTIGKTTIPNVLLGDAMESLVACFKYTAKELHKVLGTGDAENAGAISINSNTLMGEVPEKKELLDLINRTKNALVNQKDFENMVSKVKKTYDKLSKVEDDLKLKEKLPLSKSKLEDHYEYLTKIMNNARKKFGSNERDEQNNLYALYFRKGSRFLRMCEEYAVYLDREKVNRKNNEKNNIANAKIFIAKAKNHYKELQKALKSNHSGRSKRDELKTRLNMLNEEYAKVPTSPSAFAKDSNNITKYETFMGVNVNTIEHAASTAEEASGKGTAKK